MKSKMKNLVSFLTVAFVGAPAAEAFTCRAEMVRSACGSGVVKVTVDEPSYSFALSNGDVSCWNTQRTVRGRAVDKGDIYPYFEAKTFNLRTLVDGGGDEIFAELVYDAKSKKARLILVNPIDGVLSTKYDLDCEGL